MTSPVVPHPQAHPAHPSCSLVGGNLDSWLTRRWASASCGGFGRFVLDWYIFTWHMVHFQVDVFVFLGFKGGLGVMERSDDVERSPSVVI
jgi:hypothetical protein